jgi:allantoate deiminase
MTTLTDKVITCCRDVAAFSEDAGRITRTFLSPPMRDVHRLLRAWMESAGMRVRVDAAGNLRGIYGDTAAPRLTIGSHLDTVPNAGAYDGILGVALGIAMAELRPKVALEVVGFSEEEGVRFGFPFIGSLALTGALTEELLARRDKKGISVKEALVAYGLDPADLPAAKFAPETIGYLEFHIEQGPVLESLGKPLGVVDAIAGQSRWMLTFEGRANHAGTTPMAMRRDALVAAAKWITTVEASAAARSGLVATVGSLEVFPNAGNVVPGEVRASLDVRHSDDLQRANAVRDLLAKAADACAARGLGIHQEERLNQAAVRMDSSLSRLLADAGHGLPFITSGAGHDAMAIARHLPSAMLFLRSPGGISHHPEEAVLPDDVEEAIETGARFLKGLEARYA